MHGDACEHESTGIIAPTRRRFLAGLVLGATAAWAMRASWARAAAELLPGPDLAPRSLSLVHTHTGEMLSTVYWHDGQYDCEALAAIDHILRDWRTGDVVHMDPELLDLLHDLRGTVGTPAPYHVICGYRTNTTNEMLRARSNGVAKDSQHIRGCAIDIRMPGVPTAILRDAAIHLARGGVGYYAGSDFVHVDTARFRTW